MDGKLDTIVYGWVCVDGRMDGWINGRMGGCLGK